MQICDAFGGNESHSASESAAPRTHPRKRSAKMTRGRVCYIMAYRDDYEVAYRFKDKVVRRPPRF
jgi:hypothetical protein